MVQCGYWVPKNILFSPRAAIASVSSCRAALIFPPVDVASRFVLSCPVLISLSVDNFFGLCRSLSTFILASLLVMPKTPEKRTTDFRDCAATPKKQRKKRVTVDVDETNRCRRGYCTYMYIIVIILCEEYLHTKAASKLLACSINVLCRTKVFLGSFEALSSLGCLGLRTLLSLGGFCMHVCLYKYEAGRGTGGF